MHFELMPPSHIKISTVHIANLAHKLLRAPTYGLLVVLKLHFTVEYFLTMITFEHFIHFLGMSSPQLWQGMILPPSLMGDVARGAPPSPFKLKQK